MCPQLVTLRELEYWHGMGLIMGPDDQDDIEKGKKVHFTSHSYDLVHGVYLFDNFPKMLLRLTAAGTTGLTTEIYTYYF